jgi:hypothetical protein
MIMKKIGFWILGIGITLLAAIYQRSTGPTYPKEIDLELNNSSYTIELPRSHGGETDCEVILDLPSSAIGKIYYKRYPTKEEWQSRLLEKKDEKLVGYLPAQPPAGKLQYYLELYNDGQLLQVGKNEPIIIRFKGEVPNSILIPHVIIMFLAMLFSTVAGLFAVGKIKSYKWLGYVTVILLIAGGFVFGPIMQHYAFGDYWTGIPFGWDLTDNKTLIAFIGWLTAVIANRKSDRPKYYVFAAILLLLVYSIPHSLMGSEYDYEKGEVITGLISLWAS